MKKHITIITSNFYPEDTAIGLYTTQLAEFLLDNNFNVSVLTGFPYYPRWEIFDEYKNKPIFFHEEYKGIKIYRYKQYVPEKPTFSGRIKQILSFTKGTLKNLQNIKNTDLVFVVVPYVTNIILGSILKKRLETKLWVHIQDFEIDVAFQANVIGSMSILKKFLYKFFSWFENKLFNMADIASTISYSMLKKFKEKTGKSAFYFPNWIDENFINPKKFKYHRYFKDYRNKIKILYSGNIGNKQDWNLFLNLVDFLKDNKKIHFFVVGDGARKKDLEDFINRKKLKNITLFSPVPYEELPDLLCSADIHILLQKVSVVDSVMPSKLLGMMASEKPSFVVGNKNSEVKLILEKSQGGIYLSTNDVKLINRKLLELANNKEKQKILGANARRYVIENFSKNKVLNRFLGKLNEVLKG